jgi:hypothetical protein
MKTTLLMGVVAGSVLLTGGTAGAQSKTLQGDSETATVTIESIEHGSRTMTVKDDKGVYETVDVPREFKGFSELKVGDTITARYYENVVIRLKKPGEAAVDVGSEAVTRGAGSRPAGTAATQRTITVTVTAMDPKAKSVTVKGPNGYTYSRRVQDKKAFDQLKVGDRLDMTWTNALLLSVDTPKK